MDQAEALLAVTGLRRVLDGVPPTKEDLARSIDLEKELKSTIVSYLRGKRKGAAIVQNIDLPPSLPEDAHNAVDGLHSDVAVGYGIAAARALTYLNTLVQQRSLPGLTAKVADRTAGEKSLLRRAMQAVEDPIGVLGDIGSLSDDQIETMKNCFPTMWSDLGMQAAEAMAKVNKTLSSREEQKIGRLMGVSVGDVNSIQALYAQDKAEKQAQGQTPEMAEMGTATQKIAAA